MYIYIYICLLFYWDGLFPRAMFALMSVPFLRAAQVAVGLGIQLRSERCNGSLQNSLTLPEAAANSLLLIWPCWNPRNGM